MIYYFLVLFITFIFIFIKDNRLKGGYLILLSLFLLFGYTTGTDWRNYEKYFYDYQIENLFDYREEKLYVITSFLFKKIGSSFWFFHVLFKSITFIILCLWIRKSKVNFPFFFLIFLPEIGFYLFLDCPFRNMISLGLFLISTKYLYKRDALKYFLINVIALGFHSSAIVVFPLYFISIHKINKWCAILLFVISNIFAYKLDFLFAHVIAPLVGASNSLSNALLVYVLDEKFLASSVNVGTVVKLFYLFLILYTRDTWAGDSRRTLIISNIAILFLCFYPFSISIKIFSRFFIFLYPSLIVSILYSIRCISFKLKHIFIVIILMYSFTKTYYLITADYRYVPYTNILTFGFYEYQDSFSFRNSYNQKYSPYKGND